MTGVGSVRQKTLNGGRYPLCFLSWFISLISELSALLSISPPRALRFYTVFLFARFRILSNLHSFHPFSSRVSFLSSPLSFLPQCCANSALTLLFFRGLKIKLFDDCATSTCEVSGVSEYGLLSPWIFKIFILYLYFTPWTLDILGMRCLFLQLWCRTVVSV